MNMPKIFPFWMLFDIHDLDLNIDPDLDIDPKYRLMGLSYMEYFKKNKIVKINKNVKKKETYFPSRHYVPYYLDDNFFHCKSFFDESTIENNESNDVTIHSGHRMFDLHSYTQIGAEEAVRRIFTSVDRSRQQVIKINVGQGIHSQSGVGKLSDVVKKVAKDLQLPDPVRHEKNPGYLLMILPPIIASE